MESPPPQPSGTGIMHMPPEILGEIFSHFQDTFICDVGAGEIDWRSVEPLDPPEDIRNGRLVCRRFNEGLAPLLLPMLTLRLDQKSLDRAERISRSPLASGVRAVRLMLSSYSAELAADVELFGRQQVTGIESADISHLSPKSWKKVEDMRQRAMDAWEDELLSPPTRPTSQTCPTCQPCPACQTACPCGVRTRDREATVGWYRSRLFEAHAKYRKLHADQCRLMEDGLYARSLAASLSRMPRFRSLRIDDEDDYLDESFCIGYEDDEDTQEAYGVRGGIFHYEMDIPLVLRDGMILMETMTRWYRWSSVECIADEQEHQGRRPQAENLAMGIIFDLPMAILQAGITLRDFDLRCFPVTARGQSLVDPARRGGDFSAAFRRLEHCRVYISENTEYDWRTRPDDRFGAADRYIAAAVSSPALRALHLDLGVGMLEARRNYPAATVLAAVTSDRIAEVSLIRLKADGADLASFSSKLSDGFRDVSYDWLELTGGSWWPIMRTLVVKRSACGKGRIGRLNTWPLEGRECAAAFREYMRGIRDPRIYFFLDSPTSGKVVVRSEPTARSHSLCKYLEKRGIGL